jgi:ubiquinone/menaquinone biosynthesis C-methylase UbiE
MALQELCRVLKTGGHALILVPDMHRVFDFALKHGIDAIAYESPAGSITPLDMIYGHSASIKEGNSFMAHKTGFTEKLLQKLMQKYFGVVQVQLLYDFDLFGCGVKC